MNSKSLFHYIALFLMCFIAHTAVYAQDTKPKPIIKSTNLVSVDGKSYLIHKVEPGQTLYAISKAYSALISDIEFANNGLPEGLKSGMDLRIPVPTDKKSKPISIDNTGKYILHTVEKKQTLYAISKKYNVSVDDITTENPEIVDGLREGIVIKIPQKDYPIEEPIVPVLETPKKGNKATEKELKSLSVNLFLPFYLLQNDSIINKENLVETDNLFAKSVPGIEFLSGFQMACDSLLKTGIPVSISVYDTPSDSASAVSFFARKTFNPADLWVGPFHSQAATAAANAIKKTNALLVLPYSTHNKLLLGNERVIKLSPSMPTELEQMAIQLIEKNKQTNFVVVHNSLTKEKSIVSILKKAFKQNLKNDSLREVIFKTVGSKGLISMLSRSKNNMIIVASSDQAFVTDLINKLRAIDDKEYKIAVTGMESWINYENLDLNTIQKLNVQIPAESFVNYSDTATNYFIKAYRSKFLTEPGKYAFSGYDVAMYFVPLLKQYGGGAINKLDSNRREGMSMNFYLKKTGDDSGFENQTTLLLKYVNYELIKQ